MIDLRSAPTWTACEQCREVRVCICDSCTEPGESYNPGHKGRWLCADCFDRMTDELRAIMLAHTLIPQ